MKFSLNFKKSIAISLFGHLTIFSIFGLSFGTVLPKIERTSVYFWGQHLRNSELSNIQVSNIKSGLSQPVNLRQQAPLLSAKEVNFFPRDYLRPAVLLAAAIKRPEFIYRPHPSLMTLPKKESVIMFHPVLPSYFTLFFQDRQLVHIELEFKIFSDKNRAYFEIKRKVSSGNLEADLLSMRYIGHYLFIQGKKFTPNNRQTIKIELSVGK